MLNVGKYTIQMVWDMYQTINSEKAIHFNPLVSGSYAAEQLGIMDKDLIFGAANVFIVCQRGLLDNNRYVYSISYCINIFLFVCLFVWLCCCVVVLLCCVVVLLCCCVVVVLLCCCCCVVVVVVVVPCLGPDASINKHRGYENPSTDTYQDLLHRLDILPISPYSMGWSQTIII